MIVIRFLLFQQKSFLPHLFLLVRKLTVLLVSVTLHVFSIKVLTNRHSPSKLFFQKGALKTYRKFTGEHSYGSAISKKLQSRFFEILLRHCRSPLYLPKFFRTIFSRSTSGGGQS